MHSHHDPLLVNDIHSALNPTRVASIRQPRSVAEIRAVILEAAQKGVPVALCAGRHAMGGQQFAADAVLLDMGGMRRVLGYNADAGLIEVEA
uniref:FAD-binding protein n=1 Tax=Acinetobacter ursingii TaxID=108980 RepID=UPI001250B336